MLSAELEVPSNPEDAEPKVVLSLDAEIRWAIHRGDEAQLRKIIESGTRAFDDADDEGCYMLQWAALSNQIGIIRYLVGLGANIDGAGGVLLATPLLWSVRGGHLRAVVELVKLGADMYVRDKNGGDAFMAAAGQDLPGILAYLLAKDAQNRRRNLVGDGDNAEENHVLKRKDNNEYSAMMWAIRCETIHPLRVLVFYGAAEDNAGSLLQLALQYSPLTFMVCRYLTHLSKVKIDWEQKDEDGHTVLDLIDSSPTYRMVSRLLYAAYYRDQMQAVKEKEKNSGKSPSPIDLFKRSVRRIKIDENVQKSLFPILPVFAVLWVGYLVESDHGYICKFIGISAVYAAHILSQIYAINPFEVSSLAPLVFSLGTIAIHYASFFYALYPLQLVLAPWWLDPLMWVGHVLLLSIYAKLLFADPGVIPAYDGNDERQKTEVDELIVQLAENGPADALDPKSFCYTCFIRRPLRSKHCKMCDRCVSVMDHHCLWVNDCVGEGNQGWFILSCFGFIIALLWHMLLAVLYNVSIIDAQFDFILSGSGVTAESLGDTDNATIALLPPLRWSGRNGDFFGSFWRLCSASPWTTWCFVISLLFLVFVSHLFFLELKSVLVNVTRNEMINWKRYEQFIDPITRKFRNPYDRGSRWENAVDRIFNFRRSNSNKSVIDWKKIYTMDEYQRLAKKQG